ncbi:DUF3108 domain-containing protein [Sinimarinibacterium thermocellulolyticum]|uniref:DUF3108 domain-containing protein n=1 Tax=Sinimarinibacterium thermocellulolyticum TaxID=3170016 RepID=A0ABV2AB75_9GAMM
MKRSGLALVTLLAAGLWSTQAVAFDARAHLQPRTDRYTVQWGGISLGEGTIALIEEGEGCYRFESTTDPIAIVRWTYGAPRERSRFCVRDGRILPQTFEYVNDKRHKDAFRLDFDWNKGEVRTLRRGEISVRELPEDGAYDRFVIREVVRLWVLRHAAGEAEAEASFTMVDDDRIKTYRFAIGERETIDTPSGRIEALRVDRIDERRPHRYWLDPQRGYLPVRIEQMKDGKAELRMLRVE